MADFIPWYKYETLYAKIFKHMRGNLAKPFRMAMGSLIIQMKFGYSDRELIQ
jgi:transposase, IS5 family